MAHEHKYLLTLYNLVSLLFLQSLYLPFDSKNISFTCIYHHVESKCGIPTRLHFLVHQLEKSDKTLNSSLKAEHSSWLSSFLLVKGFGGAGNDQQWNIYSGMLSTAYYNFTTEIVTKKRIEKVSVDGLKTLVQQPETNTHSYCTC